jgi:hypothetical protein
MRSRFGLLALVAGTLLTTATALAQCPAGFTPIFNGKDLTGWQGLTEYWSVEDGCLTGKTTAEHPLTRSTYLFYHGDKWSNFELRATYRFVGKFGNSGINFRTEELPNLDVRGYQGDMETGNTYTGILFDVKRASAAKDWKRQILTQQGQRLVIAADGAQTVTQLTPAAELKKLIKPNDWNQYVIIARGPEITLQVNGAVFSHVSDHEPRTAPQSGLIALQLHRGPPMKVQFKSICVKRLP